jgi:hypothetical protein
MIQKKDLATCDLDSKRACCEFDSEVDGLRFCPPTSWRSTAEWDVHFDRPGISDWVELGSYPTMSLEQARDAARQKLAELDNEMATPTTQDCAAYDVALQMLKAGDLQAKHDVLRGFKRIAQVPQSTRWDSHDPIVALDRLPPAKALLAPIEELELSTRGLSGLKNDGVDSVARLLAKSDAQLLRTPNLGRKTLAEIRQALDIYLDKWRNELSPPAQTGVSLDHVRALQAQIIERLEQQNIMMKALLGMLEHMQ